MKNHILLILASLFIFQCQQKETYDPLSAVTNDVAVLASDSLQGREVGTEAEKMAAEP